MKKVIEKQKDLYICFIDYVKTFERVKHQELIKVLEQIGIDEKNIIIIANLYWNQIIIIIIINNNNLFLLCAVKLTVVIPSMLYNEHH